MTSLSVSGPFLQGHTLSFQTGSSQKEEVAWDGVPILQGHELDVALVSGLVRARKHNSPVVAWERLSGIRVAGHLRRRMRYASRSYVVTLPLGVEMTVNIALSGHKFIDLVLTMHKEPDGQRGHCGNFNGDPNDDRAMLWPSNEAMRSQVRRLDAASPQGAAPAEATEDPVADVCTVEARANATAVCTALCGDGGGEGALAASFVKGCVYDVCQGGEELAVFDCLVAWQTQLAIASALPATTTLVGAGCCKPWREIIANTLNLTRKECAVECASHSECNAFAISGCSSSSDETCGGQCHLYDMNSLEEAVAGACYESAINGNTFCYTVQ